VFSFRFGRAAARPPAMTVESLDFFPVQQMIPPVFFRRELSLLDELSNSDGCHPQNFSSAFGGD
jgi:hypothetical protein